MPYLVSIVFHCCSRFTSAVVYQGLVMRLGIIGGNLYIDFFISGVVELPAALLILLTIERFGRRLPFAGSNIVAGVACLVTAFLPEGNSPPDLSGTQEREIVLHQNNQEWGTSCPSKMYYPQYPGTGQPIVMSPSFLLKCCNDSACRDWFYRFFCFLHFRFIYGWNSCHAESSL